MFNTFRKLTPNHVINTISDYKKKIEDYDLTDVYKGAKIRNQVEKDKIDNNLLKIR